MNLKRGLNIPNEVVIQKGRQYNGHLRKREHTHWHLRNGYFIAVNQFTTEATFDFCCTPVRFLCRIVQFIVRLFSFFFCPLYCLSVYLFWINVVPNARYPRISHGCFMVNMIYILFLNTPKLKSYIPLV
jgi:hypothetical protein